MASTLPVLLVNGFLVLFAVSLVTAAIPEPTQAQRGGGPTVERCSRCKPPRPSLHWLLLLLIGAACGGTTEPEEVFKPTEEQAVAMFKSMHGLEANPARFTVHESEDSIEIRCPKRGGAWYLGGVEVREFDTFTEIEVDLVVVTRGCVMVTDEGERFSVTANPTY